jgi:hypothetical protein
MLISLNTLKPITRIPHRTEYERWQAGLSRSERDAILEELDRRIDDSEVRTSSWLPGADWSGTVFQPIYDRACNRNPDAAALCFGLMLWEVMQRRPERWAFGRYELEDVPIEGLTYFMLRGPRAEHQQP